MFSTALCSFRSCSITKIMLTVPPDGWNLLFNLWTTLAYGGRCLRRILMNLFFITDNKAPIYSYCNWICLQELNWICLTQQSPECFCYLPRVLPICFLSPIKSDFEVYVIIVYNSMDFAEDHQIYSISIE